MSNPLDTQHGGNHYKGRGIQPVQYAHANKLDFFQGSVVKYVTRFRDKGGKQDLMKAKHFIEILIELEYPEVNPKTSGLADFVAAVMAEHNKASTKFPSSDCSTIALMEEVGEVAKAMLDESPQRIYDECVQVAVMAARVALEGDPSAAGYRARSGADK